MDPSCTLACAPGCRFLDDFSSPSPSAPPSSPSGSPRPATSGPSPRSSGKVRQSAARARSVATYSSCDPGIFELIASLIIFVMGVSMLKMDRAKAKWRVKLQKAFAGQRASLSPAFPDPRHSRPRHIRDVLRSGGTERAVFIRILSDNV